MRRLHCEEEGAVSLFVAVIALALLMAAGLAIDGGRKLAALREASHLADNAARAGSQAVDPGSLRGEAQPVLDPGAASAAAHAYLAGVGHSGSVSVAGDTVTVTVSITVRPLLLPTGPFAVTATETAAALTEETG
jgi:hypothetical protein